MGICGIPRKERGMLQIKDIQALYRDKFQAEILILASPLSISPCGKIPRVDLSVIPTFGTYLEV
jgi:hypothetical protein